MGYSEICFGIARGRAPPSYSKANLGITPSQMLLVASCYGNLDTLRPGGPLGSYADFTFYLIEQKELVFGVSDIWGLQM